MKRDQNRTGESQRSDNSKREVSKKKGVNASLLWTSATFLLALGAGSIFLTHSLNFLWWGHPDQDLVFLRDGLRILSRNKDLYSDHPGAIQSVMSAGVAWLYNATHASGNSTQISNTERWQWSFTTLKIVNWITYSILWTYISYRLKNVLNWPVAAAATSLSAASLATGVEIVQLRNETYSSLLAIAALSTAASCTSGAKRYEPHPSAASLANAAIYSAAAFASLMAKVQAIFLFAVYAFIAVALDGQRKTESSHKKTTLKVIASLGFSIVISLTIISMEESSWQLGELTSYAATLFLVILPAFIHLTSCNKDLGKDIAFRGIIIAAVLTATAAIFEWFSSQWVETGLNPLLSAKYGTLYQSCSGLECKGEAVINGIQHLMKRTFYGNLTASAGGSLLVSYFTTNLGRSRSIPLKWILALISASTCLAVFAQGMGILGTSISLVSSLTGALLTSDKSKKVSNNGTAIGGYLFWSSLILAGISAQRWAVDSYLIYYQPLLYLAILVGASKARFLLSPTTVYLFFSALQINAGFLKEMPVTFQRATNPDGYHWLCSSQHSGDEWRGTIVNEIDCEEVKRRSRLHKSIQPKSLR